MGFGWLALLDQARGRADEMKAQEKLTVRVSRDEVTITTARAE